MSEKEQREVILATIAYLKGTIVERHSQITELEQQNREAQERVEELRKLLSLDDRVNQLFQ